MKRHRVICSGERVCGCVHDVKRKIKGEIVLVGEPVINPSMNQCAIGVNGHSANKYCCLANQIVHIIR